MYLACRHIKPNGLRCKSPALRGRAFCYFHARLHVPSRLGGMSDVQIPVPEDTAAIQLGLSQVFEALLTSRIDAKKAAQLLWGLQIASSNIPQRWVPDPRSVESMTRTKKGDDLAPTMRVCNGYDHCKGCEFADECPNYDPDEDDDD